MRTMINSIEFYLVARRSSNLSVVCAQAIASVILPGVMMLSLPFVTVNAADPDWTMMITITQGANFETIMFADHLDDLNRGNWISLRAHASKQQSKRRPFYFAYKLDSSALLPWNITSKVTA